MWSEQERQKFAATCKAAIENPPKYGLSFGTDPKDINFLIYELCSLCLHEGISQEVALCSLNDIVHLHKELPSLIADILVCLDFESRCCKPPELRQRYLGLLRCCNNNIVPEFVLKERLEWETMSEAGFQTKFIKTCSNLFYKQQKYNLYREEIEGYAKLIVELDNLPEEKPNVKKAVEVMQSLIGCFNLDPNRVLDVILESFENKPHLSGFFTKLLHSYFGPSEKICQVIGFKFGFYRQGDLKVTPQSLYWVTALLVKSKMMEISQLYSMLTPEDSKITEELKLKFTNTQLLNSFSPNPTKGKNAAKPEEVNPEKEYNQKLGMVAALIDVGDWEHALQLVGGLPNYYATSHLFIAKKLCHLMHILIDDLHKKYSFTLEIIKPEIKTLESGVKFKNVENFTELFNIFEMVLALGPHFHIDPVLMAKMIRLSRYWMSTKSRIPENGVAVISNIINQSLLPSLSLLECNCGIAEELWSLLKLFPIQSRYQFYYNWNTSENTDHPLLMKVKADSIKKIKYIMKRLSMENVKSIGRQIAKLSHSNPGYMFDYILSQIQTWDNFITPVIDSLSYLTSLSYDVLAYCVIKALGNTEKERMNHEGNSISLWMRNLAKFGGALFKKYPIDISGLLQHVANQLIAGKSLDLLILKEVMQKMTGIETAEDMTAKQLEAVSGGKLLRSKGAYFNHLVHVKKSSHRLKDSLLDQNLAIPLCLLMAQQRNCILFQEGKNYHVKLVGKLYDQCQDTLVQYGSFLANSLNMEDYINRLPPVSVLLSEYSIQADVAFYLSRPSLSHAINSKFEEQRKLDKSMETLSTPQSLKKYLEVVDAIIIPIVQSVRLNQVHIKTWEYLNPKFYVTFWSLSMYDLMVPTASYEREVSKLQESKDAGKKKDERERCDAVISKLKKEEKLQQEHCLRVMARLKIEKDDWFQSKTAKSETITQFLHMCLLPRCIFSHTDALYSAKFINLIHCLKTPNFSTLMCYERLFLRITIMFACSTENEANRYGLLLCSMLETTMRWFHSRENFNQECADSPGFESTANTADTSMANIHYDRFRGMCYKWHTEITKSMLECLDSGDYIQIRNSLLVLLKISPKFPVLKSLGMDLQGRVEKIIEEEKEKRPDIAVLAFGCADVLKKKCY